MNRTNLIEDLTLLPLPPWWQSPVVLGGIALAVLALAGLLVWWLRRARPEAPARPAPPRVIDHAAYLRALAELRGRQRELGAYRLGIAVSDLLRRYIEEALGLPLPYQTTREFLESAARHPALDEPRRADLGRFLGACDLVKFARQDASEAEQSALLDTAEAFIRHAAPVVAPSAAEAAALASGSPPSQPASHP